MIEQGFTVLATILVMMGVFSLRDMYQKLRRENQALKAENQKTKEESAKLQDEIEKLKEASRKRMPYRSLEHLLDLMDAIDVAEREVHIESTLLQNIRGHAEEAMHVGTQQ